MRNHEKEPTATSSRCLQKWQKNVINNASLCYHIYSCTAFVGDEVNS